MLINAHGYKSIKEMPVYTRYAGFQERQKRVTYNHCSGCRKSKTSRHAKEIKTLVEKDSCFQFGNLAAVC